MLSTQNINNISCGKNRSIIISIAEKSATGARN
jgi:hypothetical protein